MKDLLIVGLGGFIGSASRYAIALLSIRYLSDKVFISTLIINLTGCLAIGLLAGWFGKTNHQLTLFLMAGFCGGFTTFSTFALDGLRLLKNGMHVDFIIYGTGSLLGGLLLCYFGYLLTSRL